VHVVIKLNDFSEVTHDSGHLLFLQL